MATYFNINFYKPRNWVKKRHYSPIRHKDPWSRRGNNWAVARIVRRLRCLRMRHYKLSVCVYADKPNRDYLSVFRGVLAYRSDQHRQALCEALYGCYGCHWQHIPECLRFFADGHTLVIFDDNRKGSIQKSKTVEIMQIRSVRHWAFKE